MIEFLSVIRNYKCKLCWCYKDIVIVYYTFRVICMLNGYIYLENSWRDVFVK